MYQLKNNDFKKIEIYQKIKNEDIALYFFEKFRNDLVNVIFDKINNKFKYNPMEKGDIIHLLWSSLKKTLEMYKDGENFNSNLINNCYQTTIKEVRKFFNNSELIMNRPISLEKYNPSSRRLINNNKVCYIEKPREIIIGEIINLSCEHIKKYSQATIKKIIYLKSMGYSIKEICFKLRKNRYFVTDVLKNIEKIVKKFYELQTS